MTSEQNKQWQKSINPLDYLDFHIYSQEGLDKFERRMKVRKRAPGWAVQARNRFVFDGFQRTQPWVLQFALRSEVAMVGVPLLYPEFEERASLYRKLMLDFLHRALIAAPVELPELETLCTLCIAPDFSDEEWADLRRVIRKRLAEFTGYPAERVSLVVTQDCIDAVRSYREDWWPIEVFALPAKLTWLHEARADSALPAYQLEEMRRIGAIQPVADAFLTALEAECPTPDWISV